LVQILPQDGDRKSIQLGGFISIMLFLCQNELAYRSVDVDRPYSKVSSAAVVGFLRQLQLGGVQVRKDIVDLLLTIFTKKKNITTKMIHKVVFDLVPQHSGSIQQTDSIGSFEGGFVVEIVCIEMNIFHDL